MIERKSVHFLLREKLHRKFPLEEITGFDGLEHIAVMEVLISAGNLHGLIPNGGLQAELRTPVEFDEGRFAGIVNQPERTSVYDTPGAVSIPFGNAHRTPVFLTRIFHKKDGYRLTNRLDNHRLVTNMQVTPGFKK